jgi:hypothetical protein
MKTIVAATTKRVAAKMKEDRDIILDLSFNDRLITTETLALKLEGRIRSYHIRKDEEVLGLVTKNYFFPRCGLATQILRHRRSRNKDPGENGLFPFFLLGLKREKIAGRPRFNEIVLGRYLKRRSIVRCNLFRSFLIFSC